MISSVGASVHASEMASLLPADTSQPQSSLEVSVTIKNSQGEERRLSISEPKMDPESKLQPLYDIAPEDQSIPQTLGGMVTAGGFIGSALGAGIGTLAGSALIGAAVGVPVGIMAVFAVDRACPKAKEATAILAADVHMPCCSEQEQKQDQKQEQEQRQKQDREQEQEQEQE